MLATRKDLNMSRKKTKSEVNSGREFSKSATSLEEQENRMIYLATNLAEQQLRDGTASSQVLTHYLKLGTMKERLELEKLERENALLRAKTDAIESGKEIEELYTNALKAMTAYRGDDDE